MSELMFLQSLSELTSVLNSFSSGKSFYVIDEKVHGLFPGLIREENSFVMKSGEKDKAFYTVEKICRGMLYCDCGRDTTVIAIGGGVVCDVAGFAAAVYMRGVDFVTVPTTFLSQVDGGIGGKTGVNLCGRKNIIGAFKMPREVFICGEFLSTLSEREWSSGMGELIKTAMLDNALYNFMCGNIDGIMRRDVLTVREAVRLAATFKKAITDSDPEEKGVRACLNLGHTVGHALESCDSYMYSHGEYVLLGLIVETAMLADENSDRAVKLSKILEKVSIPFFPNVSAKDVARAALSDKKNRDGMVRVVSACDAKSFSFTEYTADEFEEAYERAVNCLVEKGELRREQ